MANLGMMEKFFAKKNPTKTGSNLRLFLHNSFFRIAKSLNFLHGSSPSFQIAQYRWSVDRKGLIGSQVIRPVTKGLG